MIIISNIYVCIDGGEFDILLEDFSTMTGATTYKDMVQPFCIHQIQLKSEEEYRELDQDYTEDDILTHVKIKKN